MSKLQRKILFIDESLEDRLIFRRYLTAESSYEYLTWEAETAEAGLAIQGEIQPDCVVLDYKLPDFNGLEILRRLRGPDNLMPHGVIMLTGTGEENIAVKCLREGAHNYLIKGKITAISFVETIEQAIARVKLEQTVSEQRKALAQQTQELEQKNQELAQSLQDLRATKDELESLIQKRTEELNNANTTLHMQALVLQNMTEGVIVIDNSEIITFVNAVFAKMFGYSTGELIGASASLLDVGPLDEGKRALSDILENLNTADEWRGEIFNKTKDGVPFTTYARVGKLDIAGKNYFVSVQEDITERKRIEKDLYERERLAHIGSTAVRLTHEIGNRLNGISTSLQLLERQLAKQSGPKDKLLVEIVQDLDDETTRLTAVLRDLRTLATPYQLHRQPTKLTSLIQEVLQKQERRYESAGIHVKQTVPETLPMVFVDHEKLSQVLLNLFDNAVEAMPQGGELAVKAFPTKDYVRVEVADTGNGVPSDIDILEPFVTTKAGGTGLGLTVARQLVAAHEGTLSYASLPGQGATFIIELPIATSTVESIATTFPTKPSQLTQFSSTISRDQKAPQ